MYPSINQYCSVCCKHKSNCVKCVKTCCLNLGDTVVVGNLSLHLTVAYYVVDLLSCICPSHCTLDYKSAQMFVTSFIQFDHKHLMSHIPVSSADRKLRDKIMASEHFLVKMHMGNSSSPDYRSLCFWWSDVTCILVQMCFACW